MLRLAIQSVVPHDGPQLTQPRQGWAGVSRRSRTEPTGGVVRCGEDRYERDNTLMIGPSIGVILSLFLSLLCSTWQFKLLELLSACIAQVDDI
jgi:hypothetical protein